MGGFGTGGGMQQGTLVDAGQAGGGGKPGGQLGGFGGGAGGGMGGGKPGGQIPSGNAPMGGWLQPLGGGGQTDGLAGSISGGNPAWSPSSAQTLMQQNMNAVAPGSNPLSPIPAWYQGSQPFRGADHPDALIGRGRQQGGQQTIRNLRNPTTQAAAPPPSTAPGNNTNTSTF